MVSLSQQKERGTSDIQFPSLVANRWFAFAARILLHHLLRLSLDTMPEKQLFVINSATGEEEAHPVLHWLRCTNCIESERSTQPVIPAINLDVSLDTIASSVSQDTLDASLHALQRITSPYTGVLSTLVLDPAQHSEPGFYSAAIIAGAFGIING